MCALLCHFVITSPSRMIKITIHVLAPLIQALLEGRIIIPVRLLDLLTTLQRPRPSCRPTFISIPTPIGYNGASLRHSTKR